MRLQNTAYIRQAMFGLIVGDALGVPYESKQRDTFHVNGMAEGGVHAQTRGTWSDDSSMALATFESFKECACIDYKDLMQRFSDWSRGKAYCPHGECFDIGGTTLRALLQYDNGVEPTLCGGNHIMDNGNGSLMRILPVAFIEHTDQDIAKLSCLTHAHEISVNSCKLYVHLVQNLMHGMEKNEAVAQLGDCDGVFERIPYIAQLKREQINSSGYVIDTLEAAIWCLLCTDSYSECVTRAVELGKDTDTIGAIAGGLAGIYYGIGGPKGIPQEWIDVLAKRDWLEALLEVSNIQECEIKNGEEIPMRNLTIKREKSFVACMATMRVYIEDASSTELIINNVSCRKLGDLKNGEEKTFVIGETAAKVFVIADMMSKDYCSELYQLPEGEEDIYLTGKNEYNLAAGNAFRFKQNSSIEALANRKRGKKKGGVVMIVALIVGVIAGLLIGFVPRMISEAERQKPKDFGTADVRITLTQGFEREEDAAYSWAHAYYYSSDVEVILEKEPISFVNSLKDYSLEQYAQLVLQNNDITSELIDQDGLLYCKFESTDDNGLVYYTYMYFYKSNNAFWRVRFCTPSEKLGKYDELIPEWAGSVTFTD